MVKLMILTLVVIVAACATANYPAVCSLPRQALQSQVIPHCDHDNTSYDFGKCLDDLQLVQH